VLFGVGGKSAEKLQAAGIRTVRDVLQHRQRVIAMFGKSGQQMADLAAGIDPRAVTPHYAAETKSFGKEQTFPEDTGDYAYVKGYLFSVAKALSMKAKTEGLFARTVTLKITFGNMSAITRAKSGEPTNQADEIYSRAAALLDGIEQKPLRLAGITLSNFTREAHKQISFDDVGQIEKQGKKKVLDDQLFRLQRKYGAGIIKTGFELEAEKRGQLKDKKDEGGK